MSDFYRFGRREISNRCNTTCLVTWQISASVLRLLLVKINASPRERRKYVRTRRYQSQRTQSDKPRSLHLLTPATLSSARPNRKMSLTSQPKITSRVACHFTTLPKKWGGSMSQIEGAREAAGPAFTSYLIVIFHTPCRMADDQHNHWTRDWRRDPARAGVHRLRGGRKREQNVETALERIVPKEEQSSFAHSRMKSLLRDFRSHKYLHAGSRQAYFHSLQICVARVWPVSST